MKPGRAIGLWVVLIALMSASVAGSEWGGRSFELRQDRLYFPVGEETLVFENSPYSIVRNGDTVFSGFIEHSWEGVSVSERTEGFFDTLLLDGLEALITLAEVDSAQTITIASEFSGFTLITDTARGNFVRRVEYEDVAAMNNDLSSGILDAAVAFTDFNLRPGTGITLSAPAPFLAVMVPNVGRPFNYRGELTTSLYYRFDDSKLALCFGGDEVSLIPRLRSGGADTTTPSRWYDFDPSRGKKLLDKMSPRPKKIHLYSSHQTLNGLTHYFADILARDRCPVEETDDIRLADLSVDFIPYHQHSLRATIDTLLSLMQRDVVVDTRPSEYLQQIEIELAQLKASLSSADSARHLATVSRIMAEDLGLFPLFRPTLYVHATKRLRNVTFTPNGQVDCRAAIVVQLPSPRKGVRR